MVFINPDVDAIFIGLQSCCSLPSTRTTSSKTSAWCWEMDNHFNIINKSLLRRSSNARRHVGDDSGVMKLHYCNPVLTIALCKNFPHMFMCLCRSDRRVATA